MQSISDADQRLAETKQLNAKLAKLAKVADCLKRMAEIEAAIKDTEPIATPKTREGFLILQRFIDDTRRLYLQAVPDPVALSVRVE